jgi:hypothetical protein
MPGHVKYEPRFPVTQRDYASINPVPTTAARSGSMPRMRMPSGYYTEPARSMPSSPPILFGSRNAAPGSGISLSELLMQRDDYLRAILIHAEERPLARSMFRGIQLQIFVSFFFLRFCFTEDDAETHPTVARVPRPVRCENQSAYSRLARPHYSHAPGQDGR